MASKNSKAVTLSVVNDNMTFEWSESAMAKWGKRDGLRYVIGCAFIEGTKSDRELLVNFWGAGTVRRALLVVSKGQEDDKLSKQALALRESVVASKVAA